MKDHIHVFIVYTVLEIVFTVAYCLMTPKIGITVFTGAALYAAAMYANHLSYRDARHKKQKRDLLDNFLNA